MIHLKKSMLNREVSTDYSQRKLVFKCTACLQYKAIQTSFCFLRILHRWQKISAGPLSMCTVKKAFESWVALVYFITTNNYKQTRK